MQTVCEMFTPDGDVGETLCVSPPVRKHRSHTLGAGETAPFACPAKTYTSHAERRMLMLHLQQPDSSAYNVPIRFDFDDRMNREMAMASLKTVFENDPIFRARYTFEEGVEPEPQVHFDGPEPVLQKSTSKKSHEKFIHAPFDLLSGPCWRARVSENSILIVGHHVVLDGRGAQIIWQRLKNGNPKIVGPRSYDYAYWEHSQVGQLVGSASFQNYLQLLDGSGPYECPTPAPTSTATSASSEQNVWRSSVHLDADLTR